MPSLSTARQNGVILVILLFGQLLLISGSSRGADGASTLEGAWMHVTSPLIGVARGLAGGMRGAYAGTRNLFTAHARNQELREQLAGLRRELERRREAAEENRRLRRLLSMRESMAPEAVGATVVQSVFTDDVRMIAVDRGRRDGVIPDLPVITWGGAVGRGVGAVVQRSRTRGVVFGSSATGGGLQLRYVPRFADVQLDDRVVTSGADGVFPRGLGIGTVQSVEQLADGTHSIRLRPEIDFGTLDEVLILTNPAAVKLAQDLAETTHELEEPPQ